MNLLKIHLFLLLAYLFLLIPQNHGTFEPSKFFQYIFLQINSKAFNSKTISQPYSDFALQLLQKSSSVEYSAGISNTELTVSQSFRKLPRNQRALGLHSKAVVLYWALNNFHSSSSSSSLLQETNDFLQKQLNPLKSPMIYRDTDLFLLIIDGALDEDFCSKLSKLSFISNLRLKTIKCHMKKATAAKSLWSYETPPSPYQNFHGRLLRAATTWRIRAYVEFEIPKDGNSKIIRGVYGKVVNVLAQKLNFTYKTFIASGDASTGKIQNGSWVGVAGDVSNDLADIGFPVGLTPGRYQIVDLSATFTNEIITFVSGPPTKIFTWKSLFWPLAPEVWIGISLSLIASIILISFIVLSMRHLFNSNESGNEFNSFLKSSWGTLRSTSYFTMTFLEQGASLPSSLPASIRIHVVCWLLFALVTSTAYRSKMVGFLTFPVFEVLPKNFEELAYSDYNLDYQFTGGAGYNLFKGSNSSVYMNIFNKMAVQYDPINCFDHVLYRPKTICIVMVFIIHDMTHRNYSNKFGQHPFTVSSSHSFTFSAGIATQIRSPFASNINKLIDSATETGLVSLWYNENLKNLQDSRIQWEKETQTKNKYEAFLDGIGTEHHEQFNTNHLLGPLVVLIFGVLISSGAFLGEMIKKSAKKSTAVQGFSLYHTQTGLKNSKAFIWRNLIKQQQQL